MPTDTNHAQANPQVVHHHHHRLRTPLIALGASCATLLGAQALTSAGDLNPPAGAVA